MEGLRARRLGGGRGADRKGPKLVAHAGLVAPRAPDAATLKAPKMGASSPANASYRLASAMRSAAERQRFIGSAEGRQSKLSNGVAFSAGKRRTRPHLPNCLRLF